MENTASKRFGFIQKELNRISDNSATGLVFIVWAYISSHPKRYALPEQLTLRYWSNAYIHSLARDSRPGQVFKEIERELPELHNAFSRLFAQSNIPSLQEALLQQYIRLFRDFSYFDITANDWKVIYRNAYELFLRRNNKTLITDPTDLAELMSQVLVALSHEGEESTVLIPFLRTGELAITLHEASEGRNKIVGYEENLELFSLAILSSIIYEINTGEFRPAPFNENSRLSYQKMMSILPLGSYKEMELLDYVFSQPLLQTDLSIVIVSQGILFSRKYEALRRRMIFDGHLRAVVSLPPNALFYSRVRMAMLVFERKNDNNNVLFINAESLHTVSNRAVQFDQVHIAQLVKTIKNNLETDGFSRLVSIEEIKEQAFVMNVNSYLQTPVVEQIDREELLQRIEEKQVRLSAIEQDIKVSIEKLKIILKNK